MMDDNKQWVRIRRSEYDGGYANVIAKNLLSCLKADCEVGTYLGDDDEDDERPSRDRHDEASGLRAKRKQQRHQNNPSSDDRNRRRNKRRNAYVMTVRRAESHTTVKMKNMTTHCV